MLVKNRNRSCLLLENIQKKTHKILCSSKYLFCGLNDMYLIGKGNKEKTCNLYKRISCILGAPIGLLLKSSLLASN